MENKMTESDYQFHGNMSLVPQVGYCSSTDNQWKRTEKKKVWGGRTVAEKKRDGDQHKSIFLSVSSINAIPDSAHEKSDKVIQKIHEQKIQINTCLKVTC